MALITVVCTGNINRSPFAAALLRARLDESYIVTSAGLTANGLIPPSSMLKAAKKAGVDLAQHRSRLLTAQDVDTSDLVLCMDRTHPIRIAAISHRAGTNTFTMREAVDRLGSEMGSLADRVGSATEKRTAGEFIAPAYPDVADPMGRRPRAYRQCVDELVELCRAFADSLEEEPLDH